MKQTLCDSLAFKECQIDALVYENNFMNVRIIHIVEREKKK